MEQPRSAPKEFLAVFVEGDPVQEFDTLEDLVAAADALGLREDAEALREEYERAQGESHGLGAEDFESANEVEVRRIDDGIPADRYQDTYDLFRAAKAQGLIHSVWVIPIGSPTKLVALNNCVRDFGAAGIQVASVYLSAGARCFLCSGVDYGGQMLMCFGGAGGQRLNSPADINFLARSGCPV